MSAEWHEANQRHLTAELARVRRAVERHVKGDGPAEAEPSAPDTELTPPPALEVLCAGFSLSGFERDVLLLCAGVELESSFAELYGEAQRGRSQPTHIRGLHWSYPVDFCSCRRAFCVVWSCAWARARVRPGSNGSLRCAAIPWSG